MAVSHSLLVVCYDLLKRRCHFEDLAVNYFDQLNQEKLTLFRQTANPTWPQSHPRTLFGRSLNPFQES